MLREGIRQRESGTSLSSACEEHLLHVTANPRISARLPRSRGTARATPSPSPIPMPPNPDLSSTYTFRHLRRTTMMRRVYR